MKSKILKTISFLLILLIILIVLSYITVPKNNSDEFGMESATANGILGEKDNTIDVVVVGDSESFTSIIPMKLFKEYGITTYLCGTSGQSLPESLEFVYKAMKKQSPKLVILEAHNIYTDVPITAPIAKVAQHILPVIKYHNRWKNLNTNDFFEKVEYTWTDEQKGFYDTTNVKEADSSNYMTYSNKVASIPTENKLYVKALNEYCKKNNAQLLILSTPSTLCWNYEYHNGIEEFAKKEDIQFLDMNLEQENLKIDWKKDTRDAGDHLNHFGAIKTTEFLGKYISINYKIEDHREDENYNKWKETLQRYTE